ncbi:MAG: hypothetical protein IKC74_05220, partial [Clostridia bacterium]|nr:hypothetical protein [Clostridia bacterium]
KRIIEPYMTRKFFWESHNNNWTAVCTGAVGGVLIYEAPDIYYANQKRIHDSMDCFSQAIRTTECVLRALDTGLRLWLFLLIRYA